MSGERRRGCASAASAASERAYAGGCPQSDASSLPNPRREWAPILPITDLPKRALQLFATLAAVSGRYRYKVVRPDPLEPDAARSELQGEILVGNPGG